MTRRARPTTVTSAARAITRCSCSTSSAIWSVCALRPGNVHSAHEWRDVVGPGGRLDTGTRHSGVISVVTPPSPRPRFMSFWKRKASSTPSGFRPTRCCTTASRTCSSAPSVGRRRKFVGITRTSAIGPVAGRSPAGSSPRWSGTQGNCNPRVGLDRFHRSSVTNLSRPAERVVAFYNQRGTAEQWIKEGKNAIKWTRLSCRSLRNNAVRLQLHALAYNLGNFMRTLALPDAVEQWSLTTLREKLVKIGAKVVSHGRYVTFQLAEVAVTRSLFQKILSLIDDLRRRPAPA